jgi:hypothetical protein
MLIAVKVPLSAVDVQIICCSVVQSSRHPGNGGVSRDHVTGPKTLMDWCRRLLGLSDFCAIVRYVVFNN